MPARAAARTPAPRGSSLFSCSPRALRARVAVLALALAATVAPLVAAADGRGAPDPKKRTSTLGWLRLGGADACVATQPLARAVEERLGRTVFVSPADADVSVEGRIERRGQGFSATIVLRDAEGKALGTRTLERAEPRCEALTESLVLIIAVMIDPDAALAPAQLAARKKFIAARLGDLCIVIGFVMLW
ncbi:MAG TPA: hypothetical protein PLR99_33325, partial [Polyangiaceae bacterium]|nr:hypothetical protein [Polyangiaceae bacterium]